MRYIEIIVDKFLMDLTTFHSYFYVLTYDNHILFIVTVDGAMLASKDFRFMLSQGAIATLVQIFLLKTWCSNIPDIFATFTFRLGSYALLALIRVKLGRGKLGRALFTEGDILKGKSINGLSKGL